MEKEAAQLNRLLVVISLSLVLGVSAQAQSSAPASTKPSAAAAMPTVDQVIDHYIQATGGRAAWQQALSRVSKGTIEVPAMNLSGTIEIYEKAPDRILSIIRVAGASFRQGFDGTTGWTDDPQNGVREQTGAELSETRREADFYYPLELKKLYTKLTVTGTEKIGDRTAYVLEAAVPEGDPDKLYFDVVTGLPLRTVSHRHGPDGVTDLREDFEDFRDVDGIKMAFVIHEATGESTITVKLDEMHDNVLLDDEQFAKPAAE
jgi:zinc protease